MRWTVKCRDILDEPADVLICSANVFLNLSGGVGGAILLRYGDEMQRELHDYLARQNRKFARRGEVVETSPCGTPYKAVLHAVAVDGFYQSSPQIVTQLVRDCLDRAAALGAQRVSLTALATGYGRMSMKDFAKAVEPLVVTERSPVEEAVICVRNSIDYRTLLDAMGSIGPPPRPF